MGRLVISFAIFAFAAAPALAGVACNSQPVATPDVVRVGFSSTHLFDPLRNDSDADGDLLTLTSLSSPNQACSGSFDNLGQGLVRFTPTGQPLPGGASSCTLTYRASDGHSLSAQSTVTLTFPNEVIFADGFESGTLAAWDDVVPAP